MSVPEYWSGGTVPWLTAKDLKSFDLSDSQLKVTELGARSGSRIALTGSILILVRGMTLFKDVPLGIASCPVAFGQDLKAMEADSCVSSRFLAWSLLSNKARLMQLVDSAGHGTGRLSTERLASLAISLPGRAEQEAIVRVVDAAEGAVRAADELIERKVAYKKALAEDLLTGRRRFPGFDYAWRGLPFSEFFESKDARAPNAHPAILSCSKLYGILLQSDRFSKQLASADHRHYKHIVPGDLVYDPMLLWDASISFTELEGVVSPAYETLSWIGDGKGDRRYFKALFRSEVMKQTYKRISQGTNARRRKAPVTDFLRVSLPLPGREEQIRIAHLLGEVDTEIALLRKQREALNEQKKGLMQKLLTGEVRLKEFRC